MQSSNEILLSEPKCFEDKSEIIYNEITRKIPLVSFLKVENIFLLYFYMVVEFIFLYVIPAPKTTVGLLICLMVLIFQIFCIKEYIIILTELSKGSTRKNWTKYAIFLVEGRLSNILVMPLAMAMSTSIGLSAEIAFTIYLFIVLLVTVMSALLLKNGLAMMFRYKISGQIFYSLALIVYVTGSLLRNIFSKGEGQRIQTITHKLFFLPFTIILAGLIKTVFLILPLSMGRKRFHRRIKLVIMFFPQYYDELQKLWDLPS